MRRISLAAHRMQSALLQIKTPWLSLLQKDYCQELTVAFFVPSCSS